jgi:hypothetical protein
MATCFDSVVPSLVCIVWFFIATVANLRGDEAVDRTGKKHHGQLETVKAAWIFRNSGEAIPLADIAFVRFDAATIPMPKAPLLWTLRLHHGEQVSGMLITLNDKELTFVTAWGQRIKLDRTQVVGIENAGDSVPIVVDDFETGLKDWRLDGKPGLSAEHSFFGKSSLMFGEPGDTAARSWKRLSGDCLVQCYFLDNASPGMTGGVSLVMSGMSEEGPTLAFDSKGYRCANVKCAFSDIARTPGWHLLGFERRGDRLRLFVDDHCLGETPLDAKNPIQGLRIARDPKGDAKLWIDNLGVSRRLPSLQSPTPANVQDLVWLEEGDQLFGRVISADAMGLVLDAKFGKRTIAWSSMRGIFFARFRELPATDEPEITFRPGPGSALDRLRAKLIRWENTKLIVHHALLGEIALKRECLDKVRFAAK